MALSVQIDPGPPRNAAVGSWPLLRLASSFWRVPGWWWLRVGLFPWWGPVAGQAEGQPGVVLDALSNVEFRGLGSVPLRGEGERPAGGVGQGQLGVEAILEGLDQPEVLEAEVKGEGGVVVAGEDGGCVVCGDKGVAHRLADR